MTELVPAAAARRAPEPGNPGISAADELFDMTTAEGYIALGSLFYDALQQKDSRSATEIICAVSKQRSLDLKNTGEYFLSRSCKSRLAGEIDRKKDALWLAACSHGIDKLLKEERRAEAEDRREENKAIRLELQRNRSFGRLFAAFFVSSVLVVVLLNVVGWMDGPLSQTIQQLKTATKDKERR